MTKFTKRALCRTYLDQDRYSGLPTLTLSKLIYKENVALFKDVESVRSNLRKLRGTCDGTRSKMPQAKKDIAKYGPKNPGKLNPFPPLPVAKKFFEDWGHFEVDAERMLCLYDVHIPFHDPTALEVALKHGEDIDTDCILLAGDLADFYSVSFHEKNPKMRDMPGEIYAVRQFLEHLRGRFPKARIIYKYGNHEVRLDRYFNVKAPELLGIDDFQFRNIMRLDKLNIELIDDMRLVKFQDYVICHGHEFFGNGGGQFPAKAYFQKAKTSIISGHLHRSSEYSEQDVFGETKRSYSSGCLCSRQQDYAQINFWTHGCVVMNKGKNGKATVDNLVIEDGQIR